MLKAITLRLFDILNSVQTTLYYGSKDYYYLWKDAFMTKESFKKFVKDHKSEIVSDINDGYIVENLGKDSEGNLYEIKNLIAFGNKVEPQLVKDWALETGPFLFCFYRNKEHTLQ